MVSGTQIVQTNSTTQQVRTGYRLLILSFTYSKPPSSFRASPKPMAHSRDADPLGCPLARLLRCATALRVTAPLCLRLKASGMAERLPFGVSAAPGSEAKGTE